MFNFSAFSSSNQNSSPVRVASNKPLQNASPSYVPMPQPNQSTWEASNYIPNPHQEHPIKEEIPYNIRVLLENEQETSSTSSDSEETDTMPEVAARLKNSAVREWDFGSTPLFNKEQHFSMFSHPNIIKQTPVLSNHADFHIILTELAKYGDFFETLESGIFANQEVLIRTYFHQLVEGVQHMHSQGVAHLDLKLENLMLGADFQLKVIDFDGSQLTSDTNITSGGTKNYRAPEVIAGTGSNFTAADVYSMAIILYALKAGEFPFLEQTSQEEENSFVQFCNSNEEFWNEKRESLRGAVSFSEEFIQLFNGMLQYAPEKRMSLEDIKNSAWYKGEVLSATDLKSIMRARLNEAAKKKEQENQL